MSLKGPSTPPPPFYIYRFFPLKGKVVFGLVGMYSQEFIWTFKSAFMLLGNRGIDGVYLRDLKGPFVTNTTASRYMRERLEELGEDIVLKTLSPVRLTMKGKARTGLTIEDVAKTALRRARLLTGFYGTDKAHATLLGTLLEKDPEVEPTLFFESAHFKDGRRLSRRQKRHVPMGGVVGALEVFGVSEEVKQALILAELLNVGKGTTNGLGQISLDNSKY